MTNFDTTTLKANGGANDTALKTLDMLADAADQVEEKVAQAGRAAAEKVDQGRARTAQALHASADSVRTAGQSSGQAITDAANKTAATLESGAKYVRDHDFQSMMNGIKDVVRRNPTPSLLAGIAVGFLAGAALRSRKE